MEVELLVGEQLESRITKVSIARKSDYLSEPILHVGLPRLVQPESRIPQVSAARKSDYQGEYSLEVGLPV